MYGFDDIKEERKPSLTEAKSKILVSATKEKQLNMGGSDLLATINKRYEQDQLRQNQNIQQSLQFEADKFDPNSAQNAGKAVTTADLEYGGIWPKVKNIGAGLKMNAAEMAGRGASYIPNILSSDARSYIEDGAIEAYQKEQKYKELESITPQFNAKLADMLVKNELAPGEVKQKQAEFKAMLLQNKLTPEESKVLDSGVMSTPEPIHSSNRTLIERGNYYAGKANDLVKGFDEVLSGTKNFNPALSAKMEERIGKIAKENVSATDAAKDDFSKGNYAVGLVKGTPAVLDTVFRSVFEMAKNPTEALQLLSTEAVDLMLAGFGKTGLAASALESLGLAGQIEADAYKSFITEKGRIPTDKERSSIKTQAYAAGGLDMFSDYTISGASKGGKMLLNKLNKAAEGVPKLTTRVAMKATEKLGAGVVNTHTEGLTEGAQSIIEDYTSKFKPVDSTESALLQTGLGAAIGGSMGPAASVGTTAAKAAILGAAGVGLVGSAIVKGTGKAITGAFKEKTPEQKQEENINRTSASPTYKPRMKEVEETGDITKFIDPTSKDYDPVVAIDSLKKFSDRENVTSEEKFNNLEQAVKVYGRHTSTIGEKYREIDVLTEKSKTPEGLSATETARRKELNTEIIKSEDTLEYMDRTIKAMHPTEMTVSEIFDKVVEKANSKDPEEISSIIKDIYENTGKTNIKVLGSTLNSIRSNPHTSPETKQLVEEMNTLGKFEQQITDKTKKINQANKTSKHVKADVFTGIKSDGFIGINSYISSIAQNLKATNEPAAAKALDGLSSFAAGHRIKASTLRRLTEADAKGIPRNPEDVALLNGKLAKQRGGKPYDINPNTQGWLNTLNDIEEEANALEQAVVVANGLFPQYGRKSPITVPVRQEQTKTPNPTAEEVTPSTTANTAPKQVDVIPEGPPVDSYENEIPTVEGEINDSIQATGNTVADTTAAKTTVLVNPQGKEGSISQGTQGDTKEKTEENTEPKITPSNTQTKFTPETVKYTNHSGGALGSDSAWGDVGKPYGVISNHYYQDKTPKGNVKITPEQLKEGLVKAKQAAKDLGKYWSNKPYVQGLLARNWQQVKNADAVFAVGTIKGEYTDGGTGYAVAMAIRERKPVYVFDQTKESWFKKSNKGWEKIDTPILTPNFAGIGTRKLSTVGKKAIESVYAKTFQKDSTEQLGDNVSVDKPVEPSEKTPAALVESQQIETNTVEAQNTEKVSDKVEEEAPVELYRKSPVAKDLTTLPENSTPVDKLKPKDYQTINPLHYFFQAAGNAKNNVLQMIDNFFPTLKQLITEGKLAELTSVFNGKRFVTADDRFMLDHMQRYASYFSETVQKSVFKPKSKQMFYYEDFLQWFAPDGIIPENVRGAMATVTYKWLATQGEGTLENEDKAMTSLLGLKDGTELNAQARSILHDIGVSETFLIETLGRDILKLVGITTTKDAPVDYTERMQRALAMTALATLEEMNMVEQKVAYTGLYSETAKQDFAPGTFGIEGLKQSVLDDLDYEKRITSNPLRQITRSSNKFFTSHNRNEANNGKTKSNFYHVKVAKPVPGKQNQERKPIEPIYRIQQAWKASPKLWDRLFTGEAAKEGHSWEKYKIGKKFRMAIEKTKNLATVAQSRAVINNVNKSYELSHNTANIAMLFGRKRLLELIGNEDPSKKHISKAASIASANKDRERSLDIWLDWMEEAAKQPKGLKSLFYIPAKIVKNLRVHQVGKINSQGDKFHRYVFTMSEWKSTFALDSDNEIETFKETLFLDAVALSIGLEHSKKGGKDEVLRLVKEAMEKEVFFKARAAIDLLLNFTGSKELDMEALAELGEKHPQALDDIMTGVRAGGKKISTLKGLVEYTRYMRAKSDQSNLHGNNILEFTTDIPIEIDGMSNGPVILMVQMLVNNISPEILFALRNGGFSFDKLQGEVAKHLQKPWNMDVYKSGGIAWRRALLAREKVLTDEFNEIKNENSPRSRAVKQELTRLHIAERLFGSMVDNDGYATDTLRKLMKDPVMQTGYSAGEESIINGLSRTLIEDIFTAKLEDIAANNKIDDLINLVDDMRRLANLPLNSDAKNVFTVDVDKLKDSKGVLIPAAVLKLTLPDATKAAIHNHIEANHGRALVNGIDELYGNIKYAKNAVNNSMNVAAALYNVVRAHLVAKKKQELIDAKQLGILYIKKNKKTKEDVDHYVDLSKEQYAEIDEQLKDMYPSVATPFEGGLLDMATEDPTKSYTGESVEQQYASKKLHKKSSHLAEKGILGSVGVSPMVALTQMVDASISTLMQRRGIAILNVHDGFYTGIDGVVALNEALNEIMFETLRDYSIPHEVNASLHKTIAAFNEFKETNITDEDSKIQFALDMLAEFQRIGISRYTKSDGTVVRPYDKVIYEFRETQPESKLSDEEIIAQIVSSRMDDIADRAVKNKAILMDMVTGLNHYNWGPKGYTVPKTKKKAKPKEVKGSFEPAAIDTSTLDAQAETAQKAVIEAMQKSADEIADLWESSYPTYVSDTLPNKPVVSRKPYDYAARDTYVSMQSRTEGEAHTVLGNADDPVSLDSNEYDEHIELNQENAVGVYDRLKTIGLDRVTDSHDSHLRHIMNNILTKVMNPVDLYLKTQVTNNTNGVFVPEQNKIFLRAQAMGLDPNTPAEQVYIHELIHAITHSGLKMSSYLNRQAQVLYDMAKEVIRPEDFLDDPTGVVTPEAQAKWDYIFGNQTVKEVTTVNTATGLKQTKKYSSHLDEFISHGLTDPNLVRALARLPIDTKKKALFTRGTWQGIIGSNFYETLVNLFNRIMDVVMNNYGKSKPTDNVATELERLAMRLATVDSKHKTMIGKAMDKYDGTYSKIAEWSNEKIKAIVAKTPVGKVNRTVKNLTAMLEDQDSKAGQMMRDIRNHIDGIHMGFGKYIVREVRGLTDRLAPIHRLINTKDIIVDKARMEAVSTYMEHLKSLWQRDLIPTEKIALLKGAIKTDMSVLLEDYSMNDITAMMDNEKTLDSAIFEIIRLIKSNKALQSHINFYQRQAQSLGLYMSHGKTTEGNTLLNAHLIGSLKNTKHEGKLTTEQALAAEQLVDKLATLYALKFTPSSHKLIFTKLLKEDPDAVRDVLVQHREIQRQAKKDLFFDNPNMIIKGYTKEITDTKVNILAAAGDAVTEAELVAQGYTKSKLPIKRDKDDKEQTPIYVYTSDTGSINDWHATIASLTGNGHKGTDVFDVYAQLDNNGTDARANHKRLVQKKQDALNDQFNAPMVPYNRDREYGNAMLPLVNTDGHVVKYRYMMNEDTKDDVLKKHNEYDAVLSAMAGQILDKVGTTYINRELVSALKDMYNSEYKDRFRNYVEIGPNARDLKHRELYYMLPEQARIDIAEIWGDDTMMVAQDVVDLAFGFRKYSITQAFNKNPEDRAFIEKMIVNIFQSIFKNKGITRAKQVEEFMIQATKVAKNNIIVRGLQVTIGNYVSNVLFCKAKGVTNANIHKWHNEAMAGIIRYVTDKKNLEQAKLKLIAAQNHKPTATLTQVTLDKTTQKIKDDIVRLENTIALNPVTDVVDAGLMQSIIDDIETTSVQSPYPGMFEQLGEQLAKYTPDKLATIGKEIVMAEDTQSYKILNNLVKTTDFIGRYIMYKQYTTVEKGDLKMDHNEAVAQVLHDFVNFNLPSHKMIEYGNQIGLIWFSKYALRILKPIKDMVKEKPFQAIMTLVFASVYALPSVFESIPFISKNPLNVFGNPLSALTDSSDEILTATSGEWVLDQL